MAVSFQKRCNSGLGLRLTRGSPLMLLCCRTRIKGETFPVARFVVLSPIVVEDMILKPNDHFAIGAKGRAVGFGGQNCHHHTWVDGQPRVAMALPDLRGLAGWSAAFEVPGYGGIAWWLQRYSATAPEVAADVRAELASQFGIDGQGQVRVARQRI